ncbi:MAG: hypothetical protein JWM75_2754 [Sphingomonas bacterium]|nr:hypothetical protein [Sphingomonas bacterium]
MPLEVTKLGTGFGAEISGIDLTTPLTPQDEAELVSTIATYGVCVFRHTGLTDASHVWFSRILGNLWTVNGGRVRKRLPQLFDAGNLDPDGQITTDEGVRARRRGDRQWHTDSSFTKERTSWSLLLAHEVPSSGGDTWFADMREAYDALPEAMKLRIEGLAAEHSYFHSRMTGGAQLTEAEVDKMPSAIHPLVHVHPGSGRKSLYIGSHGRRIVGMEQEAGRALLRELIDFATQPQFVIRHSWSVGDLVVWDNLCTMHRGSDYDDRNERRDMRRTTVMASPPPPVMLDPRFADRFDPGRFAAFGAAA